MSALQKAAQMALEAMDRNMWAVEEEAPHESSKLYCQAFDALRAALAEVSGSTPEQELQKLLEEAKDGLSFYERRSNALQACQHRMRDPERTMVCDILANGSLLFNGNGKLAEDRYAHPPAQPSDFDVWSQNPYTIVLQKSIAEDYVPAHPQRQPLTDEQIDAIVDATNELRGAA